MKIIIKTYKLICQILLCILIGNVSYAQFTIKFDTESGPVYHGVHTLRETLVENEISITLYDQSSPVEANLLVVSDSTGLTSLDRDFPELDPGKIHKEGYQIIKPANRQKIIIAARDGIGAMYGLLVLNEFALVNTNLYLIAPVLENPLLEYRIIKFNLPWSPYRDSPATSIHIPTCRNLKFWEKFLDMMAQNRFNVLSLWNLHPFPYMIRAKNFPSATPFNDAELADWKSFWEKLFRMAKDRGIQTFIVNWNIVVSPEFAKAYGVQQFNDTSELVKQYTRECVTQVINEYKDLSGIGVTLADWMDNFNGNMSAKEREDWIEETFVAGMKQADRKIKFLHRSVLSGSPIEMRRVINNAGLDEPALVEIKFNWSHGHSTPTLAITHDYSSGEIDKRFWEPKPENYNIQWMIRNEDFFILRWGQPDFIRRHIAVNHHDYVNGYFIGSEGYIPALDYSSQNIPDKTWPYGFEKQWLFYMLWGRLLYNPQTSDRVFEEAFDIRYGTGTGRELLKATSLASGMPLKLASFYRSTWDYTLYSEGFLAPRPSGPSTFFDGSSDFISIDELILHETLDPDLISISNYVDYMLNGKSIPGDKITPLALANELEKNGLTAIQIVENMLRKPLNNGSAINSELEDINTWSYLGLYFAEKLRGGVALQTFRQSGDMKQKSAAITYLEKALTYWQKVIEHTKNRYNPVPLVSIPGDSKEYTAFSWEYFLPQVEKDIDIAHIAEYQHK